MVLNAESEAVQGRRKVAGLRAQGRPLDRCANDRHGGRHSAPALGSARLCRPRRQPRHRQGGRQHADERPRYLQAPSAQCASEHRGNLPSAGLVEPALASRHGHLPINFCRWQAQAMPVRCLGVTNLSGVPAIPVPSGRRRSWVGRRQCRNHRASSDSRPRCLSQARAQAGPADRRGALLAMLMMPSGTWTSILLGPLRRSAKARTLVFGRASSDDHAETSKKALSNRQRRPRHRPRPRRERHERRRRR